MLTQFQRGASVVSTTGRYVETVETLVVDGAWRNFLIVKITTNDGVVGWGDGTLG